MKPSCSGGREVRGVFLVLQPSNQVTCDCLWVGVVLVGRSQGVALCRRFVRRGLAASRRES